MANNCTLFRPLYFLAFFVLAGAAVAQDKTSEPKGFATPRTTITEGPQDWCGLCGCCSEVTVFDPKKLLENKTVEEIDAMAVIVNQKFDDRVKEIYVKHPPGPPRDAELAKLMVDHDYCQVVPCLKVGVESRVDWKKLKDDPSMLNSMKSKGYVVLPKNASAKTN